MRKFSYEEYKEGGNVQTRDGKHRVEAIHRFDAALGPRIFACVDGQVWRYLDDGRALMHQDGPGDLVMVPVERKSWVVLCSDSSLLRSTMSETDAKLLAKGYTDQSKGGHVYRAVEIFWKE